MQHHFITGVAGFIGSHLADSLLADGVRVSGADDYSLGRHDHLMNARTHSTFRAYDADLSDRARAIECVAAATQWGGPPDVIWHLAANSDIAAGVADPSLDLRSTLHTTIAMLEAARECGVRRIAFASSSAVYGEHDTVLCESSGPLLPISNYGANKLASEALLSAAAESALDRVWIFRCPNVVGTRATHGAIFDFAGRIGARTPVLRVLGDGTQCKPYLHVSELISAMKFIVGHAAERRNLFNIGPEGDGTTVAFIAEQMVARHAPGMPIDYEGGDRGWDGDVPRFRYSTERLKRLGWTPSLSSDAAVLRAIDEIRIGNRVRA